MTPTLVYPLLSLVAASALAMSVAFATAQEPKGRWEIVRGLTSASVARTAGARLMSSAGHSWADGRQAISSYWLISGIRTIRCVTYFNSDMVQTGEKCEQPTLK